MLMQSVAGGALIGLAATWLYFSLGRIAGISGIFSQSLRNPGQLWPPAFVIGLGLGGWLAMALLPASALHLQLEPGWIIAAGLIVGIGTRLGSGCTSGHGVCGIARLSRRSILATIIFVGVGMASATILRASGVL
jgi:uncharacterized membrane protein YedE/YeeE